MSTYNTQVTTTTRQSSHHHTTTSVENRTVSYTRQPDISDYIALGVGVLIVIVGVIGFIKAVISRKIYTCPVCGEKFRAENMEVKTCSVCGASMSEEEEESYESNI